MERFPAGFALALAVCFLAALPACSTIKAIDLSRNEYWAKPGSGPLLPRGDSLLMYFEFAKGLSAADWAKEAERMRHAFSNDKSDFVRVQYALLLTTPNAAPRDATRALQLIEPVLRPADGRDAGVRGLALLLATELGERRRVDEALQLANQKQKDEQARAADLEQKLEALKAIEKTLSQRERKPGSISAPVTQPLPAPTGNAK